MEPRGAGSQKKKKKRQGTTTAVARYKVFLLAGEGEMSDPENGGMIKGWKEESGGWSSPTPGGDYREGGREEDGW